MSSISALNFSRSAPPKVRSNRFLAATSRSIEALASSFCSACFVSICSMSALKWQRVGSYRSAFRYPGQP
nr:MAG TPA: hypothetical protein [Caudoviricetes sp.]